MSGLFNGQKVESFGVNIGLGTDVGASGMDGIVQQIRMAEMVSKITAISQSESKIHTTYRDSYHWATLGGARALGIDHIVGSLEIGKRFDAIIADLSSMPTIYIEDETPEVKFERFIRTGSEKHIKSVIVDGHYRIIN